MAWLISNRLMSLYAKSHCLPEGAGESLEPSCAAQPPFAPSNSTPMQRAFLPQDKMTAFSRPSRFGMMFQPLTEKHGEEVVSWFRADFLAKTFQMPRPTPAEGNSLNEGWRAKGAGYGVKWRESLAKFCRNSSSWKMSQPLLLEDSTEFCPTLPKWGIMRDGDVFELPPLVRHTREKDSFYLLTPSASDGTKRHSFRSASLADRYRKHPNGNLAEQVSFLAQEHGKMDGTLNPAFWEWMIGFPPGWTDLQPLGTHKFQSWRLLHLQSYAPCPNK